MTQRKSDMVVASLPEYETTDGNLNQVENKAMAIDNILTSR